MRRLLALWMKEWIALSRDLPGLAVLFIMPAAFIAIMSLALSDTYGDRVRVDFAVVGTDAARIAQDLAGDGFRAVLAPADEAAARAAVRQGKPPLVLLAGSRPVVLADPTLPQPQVLAFRMRALAVTLGAKPADLAQAVEVEVVGAQRGRPSSVQQNVPA